MTMLDENSNVPKSVLKLMNKLFNNIISSFFQMHIYQMFQQIHCLLLKPLIVNLTEKEDTYDNKVRHSLNDFLNFS
jgi:hypothetical protein